MRTRRPAALLVLGLTAGFALTGCRTSPDVAAYVGDETITVQELEDAVAAHRDDPAVSPGEDPEYTRAILTELVRAEIYDSAAEHFGVDPDPEGVPELLESLLGGDDPAAYFEQAAAQGYTRADTLERVRQLAVLQAIAVAEGAVEEPTEEALRAAYEQDLAARPAQVDLGIINVPDQATADATAAALQADPAGYPEVADTYAGQWTLPSLRTTGVDELAETEPELAALVEATPPGGAFTTAVNGVPGVVVVLVARTAPPSFADVRPELETAALEEAIGAANPILAEYRDSLDIDVNPRYGVLDEGAIVEPEGGVVRLVDSED